MLHTQTSHKKNKITKERKKERKKRPKLQNLTLTLSYFLKPSQIFLLVRKKEKPKPRRLLLLNPSLNNTTSHLLKKPLVRKTIASNPSLLLRLLLPQPGFFLSPNLKLPRPLRHDFQHSTRLSPYPKSSPNQQRERRGEERRQNHSQASNQSRKTGKEETEEATTTLPSPLPLQKTNPPKKKKKPQENGEKKTEKNEGNSGRTWV
jgi:hypothetical protein